LTSSKLTNSVYDQKNCRCYWCWFSNWII
jgi:hypothetical protein